MIVRILSILGIILLCLLTFVLAVLLLILFWPVTYRGGGRAQAGEYQAHFRFRWLLGLVRGNYAYPDSGGLRIKVLWLTVYDSGRKQKEDPPKDTHSKPAAKQKGRSAAEPPNTAETGSCKESMTGEENEQAESMPEQSHKTVPEEGKQDTTPPLSEKLTALCGKLRFYLEIVGDEDNQGLVKHGIRRLGRIWKSIRPRILRAEAVVGLGEPDLTGYMYGIYWAVNPFLGKRCNVVITPDFERRILEGEITLRGRIMAAAVLYQVVRVLLDRRLRQLLDQLKA